MQTPDFRWLWYAEGDGALGPRAIAVGAGIGSMVAGLTWLLAAGRHWPGGAPEAASPPERARRPGLMRGDRTERADTA